MTGLSANLSSARGIFTRSGRGRGERWTSGWLDGKSLGVFRKKVVPPPGRSRARQNNRFRGMKRRAPLNHRRDAVEVCDG